MPSKPGTLHVVATPIGNLGDLSPRALDTLRAVDAICAEDTRHTRQLLAHFGIERPLQALHEHNESVAAARAYAEGGHADELPARAHSRQRERLIARMVGYMISICA